MLKADCVNVFIYSTHTDRAIGDTPEKAWLNLASMWETRVILGYLEHNAKRYSLFITENPRT
jgi:hypothetical protein